MQKYTKFILLCAVIISFFIPNIPLLSQNIDMDKVDRELKKSLSHAGGQNSMGRLFYIAFPPNDQGVSEQVYGAFITSSVDTKVRLYNPNSGLEKYYTVKAYQPTAILKPDLNRSWEFKPNESEEINDRKVVEISSPVPISVYVINSCQVTTDGYLAIPVSAWGKKYMHLAYWDFLEFGPWAGGFLIMASENKTKVNIKLAGQGKDFASTVKGRKIGQTWSITLNKGEGYMVKGDATSRGVFDISGSVITADKPVGLISFHERTIIPAMVCDNGRDHLNEMMPPIDRWGKKYATTELARGKDKGDYFRVICAEPNTKVNVKWYDKSSKKLVGKDETILQKAGDFWELYEIRVATAMNTNPPIESIRGTSVFEADKPILVMQYSYSANWDMDASGAYDPFMMLVTPVEQYTTATIFQTPSNQSGDNDYQDNFFNIVAIGDTSDPVNNLKILSSIKLDGKAVVDWEPSFSQNNIPGTNLFWAFIQMQQGAHVIFGDTPFGGYIYGYASYDSYGWPAATAYKVIGEQDIFPPVPIISGTCGEYLINATELRNIPEWDTAQVETGVAIEPILLDGSYNFENPKFKFASDEWNENDQVWTTNPHHYKNFQHAFSVTNKRQNAYAKIEYVDEAANDTIVEIYYAWDSLTVDPNPMIFTDTRVNTDSDLLTATIKSHSDSTITITSITLTNGSVFSIAEGGVNGELKLAPHSTHIVKLKYRPIKEYIDLKPILKDTASLVVKTKCVDFMWPIEGRGIEPQIAVDDWDAGVQQIGVNVCSDRAGSNDRYFIVNNGTMDLVITGIVAKPTAQFDMPKVSLTFATPITVLAKGGRVDLFNKTIFGDDYKMCFQAFSADEFTQDIVFISNAKGPDPIGTLSGRTIGNGPKITPYIWEEVRVAKTENATVEITNLAPDNDPTKGLAITLKDIILKSNSQLSSADFEIDYANLKDEHGKPFTKGMKIFPLGTNGQSTKITVPVKFHPSVEQYDITDFVVASFNEATSVEGELKGTGFLPAIKVNPNVFPNRTYVGSYHEEGNGNKTIKSVRIDNTTATVIHDLKINSIVVDNSYGNPADFEWVGIKDINGQTIAKNTPFSIKHGEYVELECHFKPTAIGDRKFRFIVNSDAGIWDVTNNREPAPDNFDGEITGRGMDADRDVKETIVGNVIECNPANASIEITNRSESDDLIIRSISPIAVIKNNVNVSMNENPFIETNSLNGKTVAKNNGEETAYYSWEPKSTGTYEVLYVVYYEPINGKATPNDTVSLTGTSYKHNLEFSVNKYLDYEPGKLIKAYSIKVKDLGSSLKTSYYGDSQGRIAKFEMSLIYNKTLLMHVPAEPILPGNALSGTWTLNVTESLVVNDETNKILTIKGETTNGSIANDGDLVSFTMTTLLGEEPKFDVKFPVEKVTLWDAASNELNSCVVPTTIPGEISYVICAQDLRVLTTGIVNYSLQSINPNPVTTPSVDVNFAIAFDGNTKIEITNSNGEVVGVSINENLKAGEYTFTLPTSSLSNGVYFIRMVSGAFSKSEQLIISK